MDGNKALMELMTLLLSEKKGYISLFKDLASFKKSHEKDLEENFDLKYIFYASFNRIFREKLPKIREDVFKNSELMIDAKELDFENSKVSKERLEDHVFLFMELEKKAGEIVSDVESGKIAIKQLPFDGLDAIAMLRFSSSGKISIPKFSFAKSISESLADNGVELRQLVGGDIASRKNDAVITVFRNGFKVSEFPQDCWDDEAEFGENGLDNLVQLAEKAKASGEKLDASKLKKLPSLSQEDVAKIRLIVENAQELKTAIKELESAKEELLAKAPKFETIFSITSAEAALFKHLAPEAIPLNSSFEELQNAVDLEAKKILGGTSQIFDEKDGVVVFNLRKRRPGTIEVIAIKRWKENPEDLKAAFVEVEMQKAIECLSKVMQKEKANAILEVYEKGFRIRDYTNSELEVDVFRTLPTVPSVSAFSENILMRFAEGNKPEVKEVTVPQICASCGKPTTSHLVEEKYYLCHSCYASGKKTAASS